METTNGHVVPLGNASQRLIHRLLAIGENRFQLLAVEVQEERDRIVDTLLLAVVTGALGMLCGLSWSAALVICLWPYGPIVTLLTLGAVYGIIAAALCRRMVVLRHHQQALSATMEQLRKDRACLERS